MTHTVHPYSHRLGILRDWKSRWFSPKGKYKIHLKGDVLIRQFLEKKLSGFYVADIEIERSAKALRVIVSTSRPGMIIGRQGDGTETLRNSIRKLLEKHGLLDEKVDLKLDVKEIKNAEANAAIVAQMVVEGLEKRLPFRRVMKQTVEKVMANRDVLGVKVVLAGMIGGGMSRTETHKKGRIPLQTFRADVDYCSSVANLPLGTVGVKVWIYRGDIFNK
ncbi:MAG: 30S ribosomal protein S3 [Parcubacteria group bacterium GW2011_GWB1_49_7]|uniref:Small ribosomal subunit protein uS3 n=2 Tax=root TaxID=1 RepID=A0A1G2SYN0_9BACT|nr:30S ribosomal protein S3 [uncultured organism]KKU50159.1 MAG: 30S ribosomal protein S3 [Parcubacteria group bacterium GW2011_GWA1_47_10]KKW09676.1 MAG: 30S ribosomal protein S3 [Parcubacteria group bacterium GW2011_GWB1_49_7]OHA90146.1 MAG: 30S ribosomal protein S3 [Candidatus Zambryskibacteria bacterium RIFCSPHIGHO2_01_FULL_46_25]OHB06481.1 MAG: 30S ribosomal protein S3 [Candidatus Zambryskibacteria bacterium RIFCSPLOWO2_01_FULL_48_25]